MSSYKIIKNLELPKKVIVIGKTQKENNKIQNENNYDGIEINYQAEIEKAYYRGFKEGIEHQKNSNVIKEQKIREEIKNEYFNLYKKRTKNFMNKIIKFIKSYNNIDEKIYDLILKILNLDKNLINSLKNNIKHMIEDLNEEEEITIYFSDYDYKIVIENKNVLDEFISKFKKVKFCKKETLEIGDIEILQNNKIKNGKIKNKIENGLKQLNSLGLIQDSNLITEEGVVTKIVGNIIETEGLRCSVGDLCYITTINDKKVKAEVIGYKNSKNILMALEEITGIGPQSRVIDLKEKFCISVDEKLLGRVIDGNGNFIDGLEPILIKEKREINQKPILPFERASINERLLTGIKIIDLFLTCGRGQRMGIFAGSGVGKSSLLGMISRNTEADVSVIALIGERGREVKEFVEKDLKNDGLKKSVIVASTSDRTPLERVNAALIAITIAEYFKDKGKNVVFMMDSITRYAMALREIGLACGEPPTTKGYPASVYSNLSKLVERCGNFNNNSSITGFFTILVEGDDFNEPIADTMRSLLDGHIILSRKLAERNQYPAIDLLASVSRLINNLINDKQKKLIEVTKEVFSIISEMEDLINIGAYKKGTNNKIDYALSIIENLNKFLKQDINEKSDFVNDIEILENILRGK